MYVCISLSLYIYIYICTYIRITKGRPHRAAGAGRLPRACYYD